MRYRFTEEKGSALLAVLVITLLITLLLGSVWAIYLINVRLAQRDTNKLQARYLAEAGIYKVLSSYKLAELTNLRRHHLPLFKADTAIISTESYGSYLKVTSRADVKGQEEPIQVLVGQEASGPFEQAVILADKRSPLSVTGTTTIKGGITVGSQGIEQRSLKGKPFNGSIKGSIRKKKGNLLPSYDNSLINKTISRYKEELTNKSFGSSSRDQKKLKNKIVINGDCQLDKDVVAKWSLQKESLITCTGRLTITEKIALPSLSVLIAGKGMHIKHTVDGNQLLFYTPDEIWVENDSRISGQLLAEKSVTITENVRLEYPSLIWVGYQGLNKQKVVKVTGEAQVDGTIVYDGKQEFQNSNQQNKIVVGPEAAVRGGIFNTHQTEFHGSILGSMITHQFYFYKSPTTYVNWLKDGYINVAKRPDNYLLPLGFNTTGRYDIIYHHN